jgi:signal transduction histidine kinase/ligand-binding sensor domain-containing protein
MPPAKNHLLITGALIILIFLSQSLSLIGQPRNLTFHHIDINSGLPYENLYYTILQDHKGFIWFASDNGLHRYDGYEFKSYYNAQKDTTSIPGRSLRCLLEDSYQTFWVGSIGGLCIYNRDMDNFKRIPIHYDDTLKYIFDTRTICESPKKKVFVGISDEGIFEYNRGARTLDPVKLNIKGLSLDDLDYINTLIIDKQNCLWIATDNNGLYKIDTIAKTFIRFSPQTAHYLSSNLTFSAIQDHYGYFWVATDQGINKVNPITLSTTTYKHDPEDKNSLAFNMVWRAYEDPDNNLWICTDGGGLDLYDREKDSFIHFIHDSESKYSLAGNKLNSIYVDNQNNLYVNVLGHGFSIANLSESESFVSYVHNSKAESSIGFNMINAFVEDSSGNIWIGTDGGGLDYFDRKANSFIHYVTDENKTGVLTTNTIVSLHIDKNETLWVGTYKGGLSKFNKKGQNFKTYLPDKNNPHSISNSDVRGIIEDSLGHLVLATCGGGINVFDPVNETFAHYLANPEKDNTLCDNYCQTIFQDSEGMIWIGTYYGLSRWDPKNNLFTSFLHNPNDSTTIDDFIIFSINEDKNKKLWFGTTSGLNLFNRKSETFSHIPCSDNAIFGIKDDNEGNLWLATEKGILKYYVSSGKIENFESKTGLQGQNFKPGASYKTRSGELLFGGNRGFIAFYPQNIKTNTYIPPVFITDFQIFNNSVPVGGKDSPLMKHISETYEITLKHQQNFLTFKYVALNFRDTELTEYAFKLDGFDNEWHFVGNERKATYSNISPGNYTFRVATTGDNGLIRSNGATLKIKILPPWWDTVYIKILLIIIIVLLLGILYSLRISKLEKQKELLDKMVIQRTREVEEKNKELIISNNTKDKLFSIIAHDLKNPFSNILGFSELLLKRFDRISDDKKLQHIKILHDSADKIYKLLENLLQWSSSQTGRLKYKPEKVDLSEIIDTNIEIFQPQILYKKISIQNDIPQGMSLLTDKNMLHTIIRNLLSNAVKFSEEGGAIRLSALSKDNFGEIKISDEGVGISDERINNIFDVDSKKSTQGTKGESGSGLGLIICKEFIKRNKGEICVESVTGKGTTIVFTIPLYS